jgi:serine/threonine protein phosphatase PrpC
MSNMDTPSGMGVVNPATTEIVEPANAEPLLLVHSFGLTDCGRVRPANEDQFLVAELTKTMRVHGTSFPQPNVQRSADQSYLFVVADGMGGHAGGVQASALAVGSVESFIVDTFQWFGACKGSDQDAVLSAFQSALVQANARVLVEADRKPALRGMGTTLTLAFSLNRWLFVAHVGDSRCYLFRSGVLYRLTSDHTVVEELLRRGLIQPEEAAKSHWRHVITNAIGGTEVAVKVEVHKLHLEADDAVLLCSDGLTGMLSEQEIVTVLQSEADPERAARRLVVRANEEGGRDNITVVLARYESATPRT